MNKMFPRINVRCEIVGWESYEDIQASDDLCFAQIIDKTISERGYTLYEPDEVEMITRADACALIIGYCDSCGIYQIESEGEFIDTPWGHYCPECAAQQEPDDICDMIESNPLPYADFCARGWDQLCALHELFPMLAHDGTILTVEDASWIECDHRNCQFIHIYPDGGFVLLESEYQANGFIREFKD